MKMKMKMKIEMGMEGNGNDKIIRKRGEIYIKRKRKINK